MLNSCDEPISQLNPDWDKLLKNLHLGNLLKLRSIRKCIMGELCRASTHTVSLV